MPELYLIESSTAEVGQALIWLEKSDSLARQETKLRLYAFEVFMKKKRGFIDIINMVEDCFLVYVSAVMLVVLFINIVLREAFHTSLIWADELTRWAAIWLYWIGVSACERRGETIRIELVIDRLPRKVSAWLEVFVTIFVALFAIYLVYMGISQCITTMALGRTSTVLKLPIWLYYGPMPAGCALMAVRLFYKLPKLVGTACGKVVEG